LIDTKKKGLVDDFQDCGQQRRPNGQRQEVRVCNFKLGGPLRSKGWDTGPGRGERLPQNTRELVVDAHGDRMAHRC